MLSREQVALQVEEGVAAPEQRHLCKGAFRRRNRFCELGHQPVGTEVFGEISHPGQRSQRWIQVGGRELQQRGQSSQLWRTGGPPHESGNLDPGGGGLDTDGAQVTGGFELSTQPRHLVQPFGAEKVSRIGELASSDPERAVCGHRIAVGQGLKSPECGHSSGGSELLESQHLKGAPAADREKGNDDRHRR